MFWSEIGAVGMRCCWAGKVTKGDFDKVLSSVLVSDIHREKHLGNVCSS